MALYGLGLTRTDLAAGASVALFLSAILTWLSIIAAV